MPRVLLLTLALLLIGSAPARAGELIDRAVAELETTNVYVDPDASPSLTDDQARALRDRIASAGAGPMYVAIMPDGIQDETGGSLLAATGEVASGSAVPGATYIVVAGQSIRGGSDGLQAGVTNELIDSAIESGGGDLNRILLDLTDRVGAARANGGKAPGGGLGTTGGLVLLGLLGAGGTAAVIGRRRRRRREEAEFAEAKTNARDDLVALGDDIRVLDLDASMPDSDPQARADYDHAVTRYTEAEEQWERARRPQDLAPVGAALEEGRWAMASAKARYAGQTPPERRPPCFFDPRHGPSTRDVEWSPPYGEARLVPACEADALRVEEGVEPHTREVDRNGERVPYYQAGPAYGPFAGGMYGGFGGGLFPGLLIGSVLGSSMGGGVAYGSDGGAPTAAEATSVASAAVAATSGAASAAAATSAEAATSDRAPSGRCVGPGPNE